VETPAAESKDAKPAKSKSEGSSDKKSSKK
jgi:hypothetical protein